MKICPNCKAEVPSNFKFCMDCGTMLVEEEQLSEEEKLRKELEKSRLENQLLQKKLDEARQDLRSAYDSNEKSSAVSEESDYTPYEYVDLGLPSGLLWATCNVGAAKPEDYGNYFAWGETSPKKEFYDENYMYLENPEVLPSSADAATVNWGKGWRTPTRDECDELLNECELELTRLNGVKGYKVIGPNGNSIFLPIAGYCVEDELAEVGSESAYMSSSICQKQTEDFWVLCLYSDSCEISYEDGARVYGYSVRAVRENSNKNKTILEGKKVETAHDYIDLGLPSGLLWATCNIGASSPEKYGNYFAWGETKPKRMFSEENYNYYDNPEVLPKNADAAAVNWGGDWRMPTSEECEELWEECDLEWTNMKGTKGFLVTGPNDKSIFLPAVGYYDEDGLNGTASCGSYWSSSLSDEDTEAAFRMLFEKGGFLSSDDCDIDADERSYGMAIRPVKSR